MQPALTVLLAVLLPCLSTVAVGSDEGETADEEERAVKPSEAIEVEEGSSTVTEALQGKDGVRIQTMCTHCNSANIQVGGLAMDLVPVSRDGYAVLGGLATSYILGVLPADTVAKVEVNKGPGTVEAATPAAGGTIRLIESSPLELPRAEVAAEVGTFSLTNIMARGAGALSKHVSGSIVGGFTGTDPIDDDNDGFFDVGALRRSYAEGRLDFKIGGQHVIDLGLTGIDETSKEGKGAFDSVDLLDQLFTLPPDEKPVYRWTREDYFTEYALARAGYTWNFRKGGSLSVQLVHSERDEAVVSQLTATPETVFFDRNATQPFERFLIDDQYDWGALRYRQPVARTLLIEAGIEGEYHPVEALTLEILDLIAGGEPEQELAIDYTREWSGYLGIDWNPLPIFGIQAGARREYLEWGALDDPFRDLPPDERPDIPTKQDQEEWAPRGTIRITPTSGLTLRLSGGKTFRPPKPIFSEVCCGQDYQRSFDKRLEIGDTYGFEAVYQPSPELKASIYLASTDFEDYIARLVGWSQVYTQTYTLVNFPESKAERAEAAVQWTFLDRFTLDGSIGWLSFLNTGEQLVDVQIIPPSESYPGDIIRLPFDQIPYLPERTGSIGFSTDFANGSVVGLTASYTGSMLIQQFNEDPLDGRGNTLNLLLDELRETPEFWLVNFAFTVPVRDDIDVFGAVDNLTNEIQTDMGDPTTDFNWGPLAGRAWRVGLRWHLN